MSQYICLRYTYLKYLAMSYCMIKTFVKVQSAGKKSNRNNLPITSKWQHEQLVKKTCFGYNPFYQLFKTLDILLRMPGVSWLTLAHCIFVGRAGVGWGWGTGEGSGGGCGCAMLGVCDHSCPWENPTRGKRENPWIFCQIFYPVKVKAKTNRKNELMDGHT